MMTFTVLLAKSLIKRPIILLCVFILQISSLGLAQAKPNPQDGITLYHVNNPAQKFAYAGKLHWHNREHRWNRVIVVYNQAPNPPPNHPVSQYVRQLKMPDASVKHQYNLHYKAFHLSANCTQATPLTQGKQWRINFDQHPIGAYSATALRTDWNCPKWHMGLNLVNVVDHTQAFRGNALRLNFPRGSVSCRDAKHCINWKPQLGIKLDQLSYRYRLKLPKSFDFVKGGKLPGIGGGTANTGGKKPNGNDGFSVRMMWNRHGKLIQYVYHPDQPRQFGEAFEWQMDKLTLGKWHEIKTSVRLNTPGKRDGIIRSWLDGKLVLDKRKLRFRNHPQLQIDRFMFASFYGGSDPSWAPHRDQHLYLDEFIISKEF